MNSFLGTVRTTDRREFLQMGIAAAAVPISAGFLLEKKVSKRTLCRKISVRPRDRYALLAGLAIGPRSVHACVGGSGQALDLKSDPAPSPGPADPDVPSTSIDALRSPLRIVLTPAGRLLVSDPVARSVFTVDPVTHVSRNPHKKHERIEATRSARVGRISESTSPWRAWSSDWSRSGRASVTRKTS